MQLAREFLGSGWAFACGVDAMGQIMPASEEDKIRQAIELIVRTAPGERIMRPDFGCGIHDLVFETFSAGLFGKLTGAVTTALQRWEPRIDVLEVRVREPEGDPTLLLIEIGYSVRSTNSRFNLVFPFYLQ